MAGKSLIYKVTVKWSQDEQSQRDVISAQQRKQHIFPLDEQFGQHDCQGAISLFFSFFYSVELKKTLQKKKKKRMT